MSLLSIAVRSQSGNFKTYTQDEGLTNTFIYTIAQDAKGYLWVGTDNGAIRFDGQAFKTYLDANSSDNSFIMTSLTDRNQQFWLGHFNGQVSKYLVEEDRFEEIELQKPLQSRVNQLVQGKGDYIWVVTQSHGVVRLFDDGVQDFYSPSQSMLIYSLAEVSEKEVLLGTNEGLLLCELQQGKLVPTYHHPYFKGGKINDIQPNKFDEGFIICTEDAGLFFYKNSQQVEQFGKAQGLPSNNIKTVCQKSATTLWVGTSDKGLVLMDPSAPIDNRIKRFFNTSTGTKDNYINDIFLDRENNIWVASGGKGLWEYRGEFFTMYKGDRLTRTFAITQSSPDQYWLGTESGIVSLNTALNTARYTYFNEQHALSGKRINALFTDQSGKIWVGTDGQGAYRFDPDKPKKVEALNKRTDFNGKKIKAITADSKGNIWMSTTLRGVFKYAIDDEQFYNYSTRSRNATGNRQHFPDNIQNIIIDKQDRAWVIAPGFGIGYIQDDQLKLVREDAIKNMEFYCITADHQSDIWMGTVGFGAMRYDGKHFQAMTTTEGLLSNYVRSIGSDTLGNVWFGSSNGLAKYDIDNNLLRTFGKSEGLADIEIHPNSFFKDKQQNIWFGTNDGALRYDPSKDNYNKLPPNTLIHSFQMNDQAVDMNQDLDFPYQKYKLRFDFAGISLKEPERIEYEYFLEGFDDEWRKSKERFAIYPKVDDGQYTFHVRAANSDGLWNKEAVRISFSIKKPIWEQVWFYIVLFLLLSAVIYGYNRARILRYQKANQLLEEKVTQRTQELQQQTNKLAKANEQLDEKNTEIQAAYQKLVSLEEFKDQMTGMIVHDMKNPLNSIIALSRNTLPAVEQSGKQMLQMVMNILDTQKFEDTQVQLTLGDYTVIDMIEDALSQVTFLVKQKGQSIKNNVSPQYQAQFDLNVILRVLVNLLTNAIKYSPPSGQIHIDAEPIDQDGKSFLKISVNDSGEGIPSEHLPHIFDKFYQAKAKSSGSVRSTGLGLTFCKMVVEAHGGQIGVASVLQEGSTFHFTIPRLSDVALDESNERKATGIEEKMLTLSAASQAFLAPIVTAFESLDIYETSKNLAVLNKIEVSDQSEISEWKEEMENAVFSFNEKKYKALLELVK